MKRLVPIAVMALVMTACGSADVPELSEPAETTSTTLVVETTTTTLPVIAEGIAREVAPAIVEPVTPGLDAEQVLTATVLIVSGGDLEGAITAELIGEAEAEAALAALETGSLDDLFD